VPLPIGGRPPSLKLSAAALSPALMLHLETVSIPALLDEIPAMKFLAETELTADALSRG
jgi:hypothetical protein